MLGLGIMAKPYGSTRLRFNVPLGVKSVIALNGRNLVSYGCPTTKSVNLKSEVNNSKEKMHGGDVGLDYKVTS